MSAGSTAPRASKLEVAGSIVDINQHFYQQGWTDGLPIIPPTEDLVLDMLEACPVDAQHSLGRMPPANGTVTAEKVAINAVMAGCIPDYMPVILAAVRAVLQSQFNVASITTTTGGAAPAVIVSGPIADQLGIHGGTAVFGSGHQANASIGRALRLTMRNMGGATVHTMEKSTHGWPGKYTLCFSENQEANPWEPLHVEQGYDSSQSTVTVGAVRGIHTFVEGSQETGEGVLETIVRAVKGAGISAYYYQLRGASPILVLGPEHAAEIAAAGYGRREIKEYLFENVRIPVGELRERGHWGSRAWPDDTASGGIGGVGSGQGFPSFGKQRGRVKIRPFSLGAAPGFQLPPPGTDAEKSRSTCSRMSAFRWANCGSGDTGDPGVGTGRRQLRRADGYRPGQVHPGGGRRRWAAFIMATALVRHTASGGIGGVTADWPLQANVKRAGNALGRVKTRPCFCRSKLEIQERFMPAFRTGLLCRWCRLRLGLHPGCTYAEDSARTRESYSGPVQFSEPYLP